MMMIAVSIPSVRISTLIGITNCWVEMSGGGRSSHRTMRNMMPKNMGEGKTCDFLFIECGCWRRAYFLSLAYFNWRIIQYYVQSSLEMKD